jgi:hypothetical protein
VITPCISSTIIIHNGGRGFNKVFLDVFNLDLTLDLDRDGVWCPPSLSPSPSSESEELKEELDESSDGSEGSSRP